MTNQDFKNKILSLFVGALSLGALTTPTFGFVRDMAGMLGQSNCTGCHNGGNLQVNAAQGFSVIDPVTGTATTSYEANKEYILRLRFQAQAIPVPAPDGIEGFVSAFRVQVYDSSLLEGQGQILETADTATTSRNRRFVPNAFTVVGHVRAEQAVGANQVDLRWKAPATATKNISIQIFRSEPNGNNAQGGGDRVSNNIETFRLARPAGAANPNIPTPTDADEEAGGSEDGTATPRTSRSKAFDGSFTGGCGIIQKAESPLVGLILFITIFGALALNARCQKRRKS